MFTPTCTHVMYSDWAWFNLRGVEAAAFRKKNLTRQIVMQA
jgi:hypothetical protein